MLLDVRGFMLTPHTTRGWFVNNYCPVTAPLLPREPGEAVTEEQRLDLQFQCTQIRAYIEAGNEPDAIGMRVPLVIWLAMTKCVSTQQVMAAMASESAGDLALWDYGRIFGDNWVVDQLVENWAQGPRINKQVSQAQREFTLLPASFAPASKKNVSITANGALVSTFAANGARMHFTVDAFSANASDFIQRSRILTPEILTTLTNEPMLESLLARPYLLSGTARSVSEQYGVSNHILQLRWKALVKGALNTAVRLNAGPGTIRLIIAAIQKGIGYFKQHHPAMDWHA